MNKTRLVIGVDPGSRVTGYGLVLAGQDGRLACLACGQIRPPEASPLPLKLWVVYQGLTEVLDSQRPEEMAVEDVFLSRNARSALALGQVRGVALLAAASRGLKVYTYNSKAIKKSVVGYGQAAKEQVGRMVRVMLGLSEELGEDVSDALACAICHLHTSATLNRLEVGA